MTFSLRRQLEREGKGRKIAFSGENFPMLRIWGKYTIIQSYVSARDCPAETDRQSTAKRPKNWRRGGKNGCFNEKAVCVLAHRDVVLMPDLGATEQWRQKASMLANICRSISVSTVLEDMATDEQRSQGLDIADFLLMEDTPQMILQRMIDRNPVLQTLIDELGLELVDAEQI